MKRLRELEAEPWRSVHSHSFDLHKQKYTLVLSCIVQHTLIENVVSNAQTVVLFSYFVFTWRIQVPFYEKPCRGQKKTIYPPNNLSS